MPVAVPKKIPTAPGGIKSYYQAKIEAAELTINEKTQNLRRLEAQRNALNARGTRCATCNFYVSYIYARSTTFTGGAAAAARAGELCRGGRQSNGQD
jgi:hypothetical protein